MAEIKTKHGLPETKGQFKVRGLVTGVQRDNAFKSITTKSGKEMNILNFGIETAPESSVFVTLQGMERDEVFFSKRSEVKGQKGEVKRVVWGDRDKPQGEGFNLIGIGVGLEQDENGKNVTKTYAEFDASQEVYNNINDGDSVFVRGDIEFSSFVRDNGDISRNKKFNVKQIYGSKSVNFEAEDFTETNDFKQKIIFTGIKKVDDKDDPRFEVEAKIVTYSNIEDAEFIVRNSNLANQFKKGLKPYTSIEVWGNIFNKVDTDDLEQSSDVWGEDDSFKRVTKNYIRELVIVGADPSTIDKDTYTEETIEEGINKLNSQGQVKSGGAWGDSKSVDISDEDLPW
jgi:hypothetical protein